LILLNTNQVDPVLVFIYYIFLVPNYANIAFFRSSSYAATFLGSLGFGGGGTFPPLVFVCCCYAIFFSSSSNFFLFSIYILLSAISYNYFLFLSYN
jgi:hypothetical protein